MVLTITHIGVATMLLEIGSIRVLTDPVFDPAGGRYSFGWGTGSTKLTAEQQVWGVAEHPVETPLVPA